MSIPFVVIIIATCLVAFLGTITAIFWDARESSKNEFLATQSKRLSQVGLESDAASSCCPNVRQVGYVKSTIGTMLLHSWLAILTLFYAFVAFGATLVYFPSAIDALGFIDYNGIMKPWLFIFVLFHAGATLFIAFQSDLKIKFMLPVTSLSEATWVSIEEEVQCLQDSDINSLASVDANALTKLLESAKRALKRRNGSVQKCLLPVEWSHGSRKIVYRCVIYVFDDRNDKFTPVGTSNPSGRAVHDVFSGGGLSDFDAQERLNKYGKNEVQVNVPSVLESLRHEFVDLNYVFQSIGAWTYTAYTTWNIGVVWLIMMIASGLYRCFVITRPGQISVAKLARLDIRVHVLRDGKWSFVDASCIALGDVIRISSDGSQPLPCDGVVVSGAMIVNESMLTGEPMPIQKVSVENIEDTRILKTNRVYAGTTVLHSTGPSEGMAVIVATAIGALTTRGQLIRSVLFPQNVRFKFNDQLPYVYTILLGSSLVWLSGYCVFSDMGSFVATCLQMLACIVWSINPMLPVSMVMAQSAASKRLMLQHGVMCLQPGRIPVAGKISTMVFDKTGTLTKEGMSFAGAVSISDAAFENAVMVSSCTKNYGEAAGRMKLHQELSKHMLRAIGCCHSLTALPDGTLVGNQVEIAMMAAVGWTVGNNKVTSTDGGEVFEIIRVLDFDHCRMTSGVVLRCGQTGDLEVYIKGSFEQIQRLSIPSSLPLDYESVCNKHSTYYTLGVARRTLSNSAGLDQLVKMSRDELEADCACCGLLFFSNELKETTPAAIDDLQRGAINSIICTGDNVLTAVSIGRQSGILKKNKCWIGDLNSAGDLTWTDVDSGAQQFCTAGTQDVDLAITNSAWHYLSKNKEELHRFWKDLVVYARMHPDDKTELVKYLQNQGLIVGMCGDGGNDCGALRAAHAGLALSEADASMVAPFSSGRDGKSLAVVVDLIREGRACLATNFATYHFFMACNGSINAGMLACTILGNWYFGEWAFLSFDVFIGVIFVKTMTMSGAAPTLADHRPPGSMLGYRSILTIGANFFLYCFTQVIIWRLLHSPQNAAWYLHVNTLDIHVPPEAWQRKGDNHDTAAMTLLVLAHYTVSAYTFSYGGCFRANILHNRALNVLHIIFFTMIFYLCFATPSTFSCIFRINCDTDTSMASKDLFFVSQFSTGDVGGCFLGPQIALWQKAVSSAASPEHYWFPDANSEPPCMPPAEALEKYPYQSKAISTAGCSGPNNCFSLSFKMQLGIVLLVFVLLNHLLAKLIFDGALPSRIRAWQKPSESRRERLITIEMEQVQAW